MVCNFPDDEISWFINRITNIHSRFGPTSESNEPMRSPPVWTGANHGKQVIGTPWIVGAIKASNNHQLWFVEKISIFFG